VDRVVRLLLIGAIGAAIVAGFLLFWALTWSEWPQFFVALAFSGLALFLIRVRGRRVSTAAR
jgi:membrane protein implicated in regulation of membrane protease activity